ncbi:MAG: chemotaxis protein CheX [Planctomycetota bacterium]|jgi:chemotaxis protein CheX
METTIYENITEDVVNATKEIFSTMIPMEINTEDSFYQKEDMISTDVMSLVSFTGEHSGIVAFFCSKDIALKITSNMLGMEATEFDQDSKDAVGEVTNMIAGALKNKVLDTFGEMHLSVPIVIAGADLTISSTSGDGDAQAVKINSSVTCNSQNSWLMTPFSSNGQKFNVGLIVKKSD